jgi:hypothetical protein
MADQEQVQRTPSEALMDDVRWRELPAMEEEGGILVATHEGELQVGDITLRCYTLSDGRRIFDAEDIRKHFFSGGGTNHDH